MGKKLITTYEFDASARKVYIGGIHLRERILLITNTTTHQTIYTFNNLTHGISNYAIDAVTDRTIITLDYDTTAMSDDDTLQIFIEKDYSIFEPSESFIDPVNKLRVSNPQNLIDTDFEYGLQPSKWETVELVNNIPSFFSAQSDYIIPDVISVQATQGSSAIEVQTLDPHGISVGAPIDVQGLNRITAEGKYLVTSVPSPTSFVYKASRNSQFTEDLKSAYTTITPGQFYAGADVNYDTPTGIRTDGGDPSTITVQTTYVHGFAVGSSLYITNTIAKYFYNIVDTTANAPDGRPYLDVADTIPVSLSLDMSKTETKEMKGSYSYKILQSDINVTNNTITLPGHELQPGYALLYITSQGDLPIGGLERFQFYYVKTVNGDDITLCQTDNGNYSGNSTINLSNTGTHVFGQHQFILVYDIRYMYRSSRDRYSYFYHAAWEQGGTRSGADKVNSNYTVENGMGGYHGLIGYPNRHMLAYKLGYYSINYRLLTYSYMPYYSTYVSSNFTFGGTGSSSNNYNFVEDFNQWRTMYANNQYNSMYPDRYYFRVYAANGFSTASGTFSYFPTDGTMFYVPLDFDPEADTFHAASHGLNTGDTVTLSLSTGSNPQVRTDTSTQYYQTSYVSSRSLPLTSAVTAVGPDKFKVTNLDRLWSANGQYNADANITNENRDTFYIDGGHSLFNGQTLYFTNTTGTAPTVNSGIITPKWTAYDTVQSIYDSAYKYIDETYIPNLNDQDADRHGRLYWQGIDDYYPNTGSFTQFNDTGDYQYFRFNHEYETYRVSSLNSNYYTAYYSQLGNFATGKAFDVLASTPANGLGYYSVVSPTPQGEETPFYMQVWQIPEDTGITYWYGYRNWYLYNYWGYSSNNRSYSYYYPGDNWVYSFAYRFQYAYSNYMAYLHTRISIVNTGWNEYGPGWSSNYYSREPFVDNGGTNARSLYQVAVTIPIRSNNLNFSNYYGGNGTIEDGTQMASGLAQSVINTLQKPSLDPSGTTQASAQIVSGTRIRLTNDSGSAYDFNSAGSGAVQLYTDEVIGGADNFYTIEEAADYTIILPTSGVLPSRNIPVISIDPAADSIEVPDHKFADVQYVIFRADSGSAGGLTSGNAYYAIVLGPDNIQLADTEDNARAGIAIDITSATGTFRIESPVISGISPGLGTVELVSGSSKINGTDTLFKRYFKAGDVVRFRDSTVTPNEYIQATIASVVTDTEMTINAVSPISLASTSYYVETKINVRPNGTYTHRPFDGGVEITAGTSPNSSIVRQTRKYFRYQSGKGIQVSLAINFNPSRIALRVTGNSSYAYVYTSLPHGLVAGNTVTIDGASDNTYNGTFDVDYATDYMFRYPHGGRIRTSAPNGIIKYNIDGYGDAAIRAGLFDYQNGMYFEYDGNELYACRRSSVTQLPGTVNVSNGENVVAGNDTRWIGQLKDGDYVVIRGMSYRITRVVNNTTLHIQPSYRGINATNVIMTMTEDLKVPKTQWNLDRADGTGPSGYIFDKTKIQMAYVDYSWYGAGKIRFGFKDTYGHVRYMHEFIHNNRLEEAYMRSGNIPARYEVINYGSPTYVPGLFHWGTSIIMDGTFDDDKAYLFTAASNPLVFTNGDSTVLTTASASTLVSSWAGNREYNWYVRLQFNTNTNPFSSGTPLYTSGGELDGEIVDYSQQYGGTIYVYIFITKSRRAPSVYPSVPSSTQVSVGAPFTGGEDSADLLRSDVPLISIRLAPSVDNNLTGELGAREIINRMQLQLRELGITVSHDCDVDVILNGSLDNLNFENVTNPSLSNLIKHQVGDKVSGGSLILSLRASGGTIDQVTGKRLQITSEFDLSQITDLGNAILGGDGVFPNGPDILTIAIKPVDTGEINAGSPLKVAGRVTWTESQA